MPIDVTDADRAWATEEMGFGIPEYGLTLEGNGSIECSKANLRVIRESLAREHAKVRALVEEYVKHHEWCEFPHGGTCACGLSDLLKETADVD